MILVFGPIYLLRVSHVDEMPSRDFASKFFSMVVHGDLFITDYSVLNRLSAKFLINRGTFFM